MPVMSSTLRAIAARGATTASVPSRPATDVETRFRSRRPRLSMKSIAVRSMTTSRASAMALFDLCLQALDVREIDLAAETDEDAPILDSACIRGRGSVMVEGLSRRDAEAYHRAGRGRFAAEIGRQPPHDLCPSSSVSRSTAGWKRPESRTSTRKPSLAALRHVDLDVAGLAVAVGVLDRVRARLADREEERLLQRLSRPLVHRASIAWMRGARGARRRAPGTGGDSATLAPPRAARPSPRRHRRARSRRRAGHERAQTSSTGRSATARPAAASRSRLSSNRSLRRSTSPSE